VSAVPAAAAPPAREATRLQMATELETPIPAPRPRRTPRPASAAPAPAPAPAPSAPAAGSETRTEAAAATPAAGVRTPAQAAELHREGLRALERGDERGAENAFAQALGLDPKLHASREELGKLRIRQGRLEDAARSVRRGLEEDPSWIGYRRLAARLELARGEARAAVALLEPAAPRVADDVEYHGLLASAYQRLSRHEDAGRAYRALAEAQPGVAQWWAGYGLSRDALGDAPGALAAYDRARSLGGLDPRVLEHLNRRVSALAVGG
jgi:MSHA biogenesis protein MshN